MSQIEINDVSVTFNQKGRDVKAVQDVSLKIEKGEIYGVVGLSGAGKSTLVRTINGLQRPTTGTVNVAGVDITHANKKILSETRKKIGFIFQNFNLINNRTVAQNIAFALTAGGYPEKQQPEKKLTSCWAGSVSKTEKTPTPPSCQVAEATGRDCPSPGQRSRDSAL